MLNSTLVKNFSLNNKQKFSTTKSNLLKVIGLALNFSALYAVTKIAEYAWRLWGAC
ncbi:unannotated protein [freshwater metagenome]|jgi:hypothetical protein|uniref:Unannotated protein n=1 Tax=freshwater metagenome TaxID=449393 RepID=A0A6J7GGF4_9ZZZZ